MAVSRLPDLSGADNWQRLKDERWTTLVKLLCAFVEWRALFSPSLVVLLLFPMFYLYSRSALLQACITARII